ncbi:MutS protein-like protein 5 [Psilocybe cubensis]|uniref:MutS protein-like protein 5 n=1 Tax=Psilocybe cubensis TaxID=181762 RepID=A0ACB8GXD3_PSICU|nr:MutS protein-like protein 5 [Psilocybe cubensis]KAH9480408.1 MutS protein-like protein 5 [Psilocybe cubensis]
MVYKRGRTHRKVPDSLHDNSDDYSCQSTSPSARSLRKKVRWEGRPAATTTTTNEDSEPSSEEEPQTNEKVVYSTVNAVLEQVNPDLVLTSSHADDDFIDMLNRHMESADGTFQIRPFKEFLAAKGRDRLLSLNLFNHYTPGGDDLPPSSDIDSHSSSRPTNAYDFMTSRRAVTGDPAARRWSASVRLANFTSVEFSPLCMASIGALLDHIVRQKALSDCDDEGIGGLDIRNIETLAIEKSMQINADALLSLQVFETESHASVHSEKTKEGLSLFSILNGTKTTAGRALLRGWLLRPSLSPSEISSRHDAVECFVRPENVAVANVMHKHLKGIKNMPRIMSLMKDGKARLMDWQGLVKFTFSVTMLRDSLSELYSPDHVEIIKKLVAALDIPTFKEIGIKINEIIDWEESANHDRVCVRPHIDEDLDNRKFTYHGIDSVLSSVAEQISQTIPADYTTSLNVVYFPQLGYLICVPMLEEWRGEAGIQPLEGWTFQELLEEVLVIFEAMTKACDVCAELDCLLSFGEASRLFDYRRPEIIEDNLVEIIQGRHPLQERVVDTFVANDAHLIGGAGIGANPNYPEDGRQWNSVLLCTGANACGKVGCFVPAESARLGIADKIFTRVATRESVSKVQSAFMIDLAQVSFALRNCTSRSLILLDEFGKGTLSTDGAGLFCGVLRHLLNRGSECPKVLVATHFHDVFNEELLNPERVPVSFRHMQVMFTSGTGMISEAHSLGHSPSTSSSAPAPSFTTFGDGKDPVPVRPSEKITYLYRVAEGLSLDSHAAKCAHIFGIPSRIVERAQYVTNLLTTHKLSLLLDEQMSSDERADLEDAEAICRRFLKWDLKSAEEYGDGEVKARLGKVLGRDTDANDPQN